MVPFQAAVYSLAAVSTGGFSPHDQSLAGLEKGIIPAVIILAGFAGAIPLIFYHPHRKKPRPALN